LAGVTGRVDVMRLSILMLVIATGSALAAEPKELATAPDAVLCLSADSLDQASAGRTAKSQDRLRGLGCLRSPAGVPVTLLNGSDGAGIWSVRFRPEGMSGGITMWGRPSAFTLPDGTPLKSLRAEK
jgi:hypothetical protein